MIGRGAEGICIGVQCAGLVGSIGQEWRHRQYQASGTDTDLSGYIRREIGRWKHIGITPGTSRPNFWPRSGRRPRCRRDGRR
jgi:hypothetical protein